ncbi:AMP-binding protein [Baekduia soli]|uniref:AMP-binding protein n=1 Tax=Baekduia soli TaxID=496014 RepID=A0A5B8U4Y4_9ACTN|nr:AMP-binding protein [Baekduia soli]QEC48080.1 AMP-binding protein [Baekduia soli]
MSVTPAMRALTTLPAVLDAAAERDGDRIVLHADGRDVGTAELHAGSLHVAGALRAWGIRPGDRAAIMMANVPEFISVWFGISRAGVIEVPVHCAYRGPLLEHILSESGVRILFCDAEFVDRLGPLSLPGLEHIVVRGESDTSAVPAQAAVHPLAEALSADPDPDPPVVSPGDVSCVLYTSGTTGPAKGVVLPHTANLRLATANIELMRYSAQDVLYTAFPLFHVNAKFTSVCSTLLIGGRLVLDDRFSASRFWDIMREHGVTSFNYMGSLLTILAKQPRGPGDRDHGVVKAYGGACPGDLWTEFEERFGVHIGEHYGMTETGITTWNTFEERRTGSCGRAAPWYEVRVARPDDVECEVGEVGEIQVRPRDPDIMLREYWARPDATIEAFRNFWFHTGDRARMDEDGFFYYVDRLKDSIRRRGENISSYDVENVVNGFPSVVECAAYGVPSELGEDDVMVAVVWEPGAEPRFEELIAHCDERLADFATPRYLRACAELPKTPSQRVQKFKLREEGVTPDTIDRGDRIGARRR